MNSTYFFRRDFMWILRSELQELKYILFFLVCVTLLSQSVFGARFSVTPWLLAALEWWKGLESIQIWPAQLISVPSSHFWPWIRGEKGMMGKFCGWEQGRNGKEGPARVGRALGMVRRYNKGRFQLVSVRIDSLKQGVSCDSLTKSLALLFFPLTPSSAWQNRKTELNKQDIDEHTNSEMYFVKQVKVF